MGFYLIDFVPMMRQNIILEGVCQDKSCSLHGIQRKWGMKEPGKSSLPPRNIPNCLLLPRPQNFPRHHHRQGNSCWPWGSMQLDGSCSSHNNGSAPSLTCSFQWRSQQAFVRPFSSLSMLFLFLSGPFHHLQWQQQQLTLRIFEFLVINVWTYLYLRAACRLFSSKSLKCQVNFASGH